MRAKLENTAPTVCLYIRTRREHGWRFRIASSPTKSTIQPLLRIRVVLPGFLSHCCQRFLSHRCLFFKKPLPWTSEAINQHVLKKDKVLKCCPNYSDRPPKLCQEPSRDAWQKRGSPAIFFVHLEKEG